MPCTSACVSRGNPIMKYSLMLRYPAVNAASIAFSIISSVSVLQMMSRIR